MPEPINPEQIGPQSEAGSNEYAKLAELTRDTDTALETGPITTTERTVSYLGVELEKGTGKEAFVPRRNENYINDPFVLGLQREMATSFKLNQPILLEGGTSLGKTTTAQKMCAELGWSWHYSNNTGSSEVETMMGSYLPNPDRKSANDPEFVFIDGPVTAAIREAAEGNKVMLVIDELNSTAPNILIRLHEVLDAYEKSQIVTLSEDANEKLNVVRENLCVVGLTNPPSRAGSHYLGREALDPAQIRRWVYRKLPDELPRKSMEYSTRAIFGLESRTPEVADTEYTPTAADKVPRSELATIPGMNEMVDQFQEFHQQAKGLLKERKIAEDQPQRFSFDDREEPRRVMEYIQEFYRGDINETFQNALRYYYSGKLLDENDRGTLNEVINLVHYVPKTESRRRSAEAQASNPEAPWSGHPEAQQRMFKEIILLDSGAGITYAAMAESFSGVVTHDALEERKHLIDALKDGTPDAFGRAIAGDNSPFAWKQRDELSKTSRFVALGESLIGMDNHKAEVYRTLIHRDNNPAALNAALISYAGQSSDESWDNRNVFKKYATPAAYVLSTTGIESDERAWAIREDPKMLSRSNASALGMSLAGINTARAWRIRDALIKNNRWGECMLSLAGIDSDASWDIRYTIGAPISRADYALSLGGLTSNRAWEERKKLRNEGTSDEAIAKGVNGNWVIAAVKLSERQAKF